MELFASGNKMPLKMGFRFAKNAISSAMALPIESKLNVYRFRPRTFCSNCGSCGVSSRFTTLQHNKNRLEVLAISALLKRSGFVSPQQLHRLIGAAAVPQRNFSTSRLLRQQEGNEKDKDDKDKSPREEIKPLFGMLVLMGAVLLTIFTAVADKKVLEYLSWNEFYHDVLAKGEVEAIRVYPEEKEVKIQVADGAVIKGKRAISRYYWMKIPDAPHFEEKLRKAERDLGLRPDQGIPVTYTHINPLIGFIVTTALFLGIGYLIYRGFSGKLPNATDMFGNMTKANFMRVDVASKHGHGISFKDVAGLTEAKVEIMEFIDYLKSPKRFKELGAKIPRGALLLGPPGCGKTLLARALATESKVPFLAMAGSEFVEMLGGLGAARVRDLFKEARKRAPCIIYIDEIDAIGRQRGGGSFGSNTEGEHTLNQLLVEMDGMGTQEGVIMIAATNRADILDKALLRPGRFDRHIMIDLPTLSERRDIFNLYLGKLKLAHPPETFSERLAQMTPGMSGADISNISNEAAIHAAREGKKIIDASDLEYAIERVIAGVAKKTRLLTPTEKKLVAYHESGHALVGWLLKYTDALLRISIVPRTNSALGFAQYMPSDQKLYSREELFERMCMALGGRAAESVIFNHVTTGAQDDLKKVTQMAYDQIRSYGMSDSIGLLSFPADSGPTSSKPYSKYLTATIDKEAQALVASAFQHTVKVLKDNKDKLHSLATSLLEKEVMTYEDIERLIGPPPHGHKHTIEPHGWEGIMPSNDTPRSPPPKNPRSDD